MKDFHTNGFIVIKGIISSRQVYNLRKKIKNQIVKNAKELDVTTSDYLYCTGRWASPSKVVDCIEEEVNHTIQYKIAALLGKKVKMEKCNVICKNSNVKDAVPLHQDISYSPKSPYHLSLWLSLNDIDKNSGPLQFIVGSHKWRVSPAVDFWSPEVELNKTLEQKYRDLLQIITLKEGDAVVFDSSLWHGSIESLSGKDRYAYVSRWEILDQPFPDIPAIQPAHFGMWNCYQITDSLLKKGLQTMDIAANDHLVDVILAWQHLIEDQKLVQHIDRAKVVKDLENVKTLHIASIKHNAGDLTGRIYKNLWYSLLEPLKEHL